MFADSTVGWIECLTGKGAALWVLCANELSFHTIPDNIEVATEAFESTGTVAISGTVSFERTSDRNDAHREIATAGIRHACEHILHFATAVTGTICSEVYFEITYRFQRNT